MTRDKAQKNIVLFNGSLDPVSHKPYPDYNCIEIIFLSLSFYLLIFSNLDFNMLVTEDIFPNLEYGTIIHIYRPQSITIRINVWYCLSKKIVYTNCTRSSFYTLIITRVKVSIKFVLLDTKFDRSVQNSILELPLLGKFLTSFGHVFIFRVSRFECW